MKHCFISSKQEEAQQRNANLQIAKIGCEFGCNWRNIVRRHKDCLHACGSVAQESFSRQCLPFQVPFGTVHG